MSVEPISARALLAKEGRNGAPAFTDGEAALIVSLELALREEEYTREEALHLIEAWLRGPRSFGALP